MEFKLKLVHVPGTQMVQSDALSRRPDLCPEDDSDNENKTLLQDNLFICAIDIELKDLITNSKETDTLVTDAIRALRNREALPMKSKISDWTFEEGLIFYRDKCYVPNDQELQRKILQQYHNSIPLGHPGQLRTQEIIRRDYLWPGMHTFIKNYVKGCAVCQQHKINRHPSNPALQPVKSEHAHPFSLITMDFITDLLQSEGFDSIMVMVDHGSTKGVILEPCNKTIDATGTATILLNSVYRRYGLPDKSISDRGPQFASQAFRELG